jgi:hypothetical protein
MARLIAEDIRSEQAWAMTATARYIAKFGEPPFSVVWYRGNAALVPLIEEAIATNTPLTEETLLRAQGLSTNLPPGPLY